MEGYELFVEFQKWALFLFIFGLIMFILIKTHGKSELNEKLLYIFVILCWLIVMVSSMIRSMLTDAIGDDEETFMGYLPNLIITTIWYIYMANCLVFNQSGKETKWDTGISRGGAAETPATVFAIDAIKNSATILVMMGITMGIINVCSNLYLYHTCESGLEDNAIVYSLVAAQYNIILISLLTIVIWMVDKKQKTD